MDAEQELIERRLREYWAKAATLLYGSEEGCVAESGGAEEDDAMPPPTFVCSPAEERKRKELAPLKTERTTKKAKKKGMDDEPNPKKKGDDEENSGSDEEDDASLTTSSQGLESSAEKCGFMTYCTVETRRQVLKRMLVAASAGRLAAMRKYVGPGTMLLVFDQSRRQMLGPFRAVGTPERDIVPEAFNRRFSAQARIAQWSPHVGLLTCGWKHKTPPWGPVNRADLIALAKQMGWPKILLSVIKTMDPLLRPPDAPQPPMEEAEPPVQEAEPPVERDVIDLCHSDDDDDVVIVEDRKRRPPLQQEASSSFKKAKKDVREDGECDDGDSSDVTIEDGVKDVWSAVRRRVRDVKGRVLLLCDQPNDAADLVQSVDVVASRLEEAHDVKTPKLVVLAKLWRPRQSFPTPADTAALSQLSKKKGVPFVFIFEQRLSPMAKDALTKAVVGPPSVATLEAPVTNENESHPVVIDDAPVVVDAPLASPRQETKKKRTRTKRKAAADPVVVPPAGPPLFGSMPAPAAAKTTNEQYVPAAPLAATKKTKPPAPAKTTSKAPVATSSAAKKTTTTPTAPQHRRLPRYVSTPRPEDRPHFLPLPIAPPPVAGPPPPLVAGPPSMPQMPPPSHPLWPIYPPAPHPFLFPHQVMNGRPPPPQGGGPPLLPMPPMPPRPLPRGGGGW
mmetsp:Transcript_3595/g.11045  ORF Transcript_3595/g.11045 Transcript_3595/m.11045 type:complete len:674 (+) Transcript_3595:49-2070(+)